MTPHHHLRLLDERGQPLDGRVERVLVALVPRFQRAYPVFRDDASLVDALEEAGRRIVKREAEAGPIEHLHGYAWVTLRSIGTSRLRRGSGRLAQHTLDPDVSASALDGVAATFGTVAQIEHQVLLREVFEHLTPDERMICIWKKAGFSSHEIAARRGTTPGAIDTLFARTKQKVRRLLGLSSEAPAHTSRRAFATDGDGRAFPTRHDDAFESSDDE
jgi:DNA-directed RNA polymerase specialized sigma24 family protein